MKTYSNQSGLNPPDQANLIKYCRYPDFKLQISSLRNATRRIAAEVHSRCFPAVLMQANGQPEISHMGIELNFQKIKKNIPGNHSEFRITKRNKINRMLNFHLWNHLELNISNRVFPTIGNFRSHLYLVLCHVFSPPSSRYLR